MVRVYNLLDNKVYSLREFIILRTNELISLLENINVDNLSKKNNDDRFEYISYIEAYQREASERRGRGLENLYREIVEKLIRLINYYLRDIGLPKFNNGAMTEVLYRSRTRTLAEPPRQHTQYTQQRALPLAQ